MTHYIVTEARRSQMLQGAHDAIGGYALEGRPCPPGPQAHGIGIIGNAGAHLGTRVRVALENQDEMAGKAAHRSNDIGGSLLLALITGVVVQALGTEDGAQTLGQCGCRIAHLVSARNGQLQHAPGLVARGAGLALLTDDLSLGLAEEVLNKGRIGLAEIGGPALQTADQLLVIRGDRLAHQVHVHLAGQMGVKTVHENLNGLVGVGLAAEADILVYGGGIGNELLHKGAGINEIGTGGGQTGHQISSGRRQGGWLLIVLLPLIGSHVGH